MGGAKIGGAGKARTRSKGDNAEEEAPEGNCGSEARSRRRSSKERCRAARAAQDADSSRGTSRTYSITAEEPQRPRSWIAHTSSPGLANPWAPVARRECPLIRPEPSADAVWTSSLLAASTIVSVIRSFDTTLPSAVGKSGRSEKGPSAVQRSGKI